MSRNPHKPHQDKFLWNNNGHWWMKFSPFHPLYTQRININLKTRDLEEARRRRDAEISARVNAKVAA
jgi:hypothetical protein